MGGLHTKNAVGESPATLTETPEIGLAEGLPPHVEVDTMLHELLHVVSLIVFPPRLRLSETQVSVLSTVLCDTIRRSPGLRKYFRRKLLSKS